MVGAAETIVLISGLYALLGVAFAIAFSWRGAARIDPAARDATWGFRVLVLPGAAALWPWLLIRWIRRGRASA